MSNIAIRVDNLAKQYKIGAAKYRHDSLRDHLTDWAKSLFVRNGRRLPQSSERSAPSALPSPEGYIWALKDVSFEVKQGEVVGIIGRNGAGKSTLLKILSRITEPTGGFVEMRGRAGSLLEVGTGFHRDLTGRENIYLNGAILGMKKMEIDRKLDEIVEFSEIAKFIDTPVKRYSSGMYVRLAFAVAAHLDPEILIVDEVLAVGDASFQKKCVAKLGGATKEGRTVLFVSHNMGAISALTTRCLWIDSGNLRLDGPTKEGVAAYIGSSYEKQAFWRASHVNDKPMQILRIRVSSRGTRDGGHEFDVGSAFQIGVEYAVRRVVRDAVIAINIHASDGTHLISLEDIDQNPGLLLGRQPGTYCTNVSVPGTWLNSGSYLLRAECGVPGVLEWDRIERLTFRLVETGDPLTRKHRGGHLLPMLKWETRVATQDLL